MSDDLGRRDRKWLLSAALSVAMSGPSLAQSSTTPPPTAPSAVPVGGQASAPEDPGRALPPAGQGSGSGASRPQNTGGTPLRNDATPPGITKAGQ